MNKKVTIIIPTYNRAKTLERLLESIKKQTYRDYEVIIVDDHSDNQEEYNRVVKKFEGEFAIRYVTNSKNMGAPYCRNKGIELSRGQLLAFVDDDDEWKPLKLEKQIMQFEKPYIGLVYTGAIAVDEEGNEIYHYDKALEEDVQKQILKECFIPSSSVMTTKAAAIKVNGFDEEFPACQDWDMWTRIIFAGIRVAVVRENLMIYHKHSGPSIGSSPRAKEGYRKYYQKHLVKFIKKFMFSKDIKYIAIAFKKAFA